MNKIYYREQNWKIYKLIGTKIKKNKFIEIKVKKKSITYKKNIYLSLLGY